MKHRVCIDAGHGQDNATPGLRDPGAVARGVREADVALRHTLALRQECIALGLDVFLTRRDTKSPAPLGQRAASAERAGCALLLSLHANAARNDGATGVEALYRTTGSAGLAQQLATEAAAALGLPCRGIRRRPGLAVLRFSRGPAVLLELGFLTNARDRRAVSDPFLRRRTARALARVIRGHLAEKESDE